MGGDERVKMVADTKRQNEPGHGDAPTKDKELAEVCARFADLCHYFSQQNMDLPAHIVDEVRSVSKLAAGERIGRMKRLNQEVMEYLHDANLGSRVRQ
jgi:hypothetical protein